MQTSDPTLRTDIPTNLTTRTVTPARNYHLTTNTTSFDIEASGPGLVALTEAWLPHDFRVTLDGQRVHYLRLNHAFKGVFVPTAGSHHLEFTYRPQRFTLALNLATLGLGLLGLSAWLVGRAEKKG
jgi:uncharacterized membrane protein YfhO